jgi:hypothetical protein
MFSIKHFPFETKKTLINELCNRTFKFELPNWKKKKKNLDFITLALYSFLPRKKKSTCYHNIRDLVHPN